MRKIDRTGEINYNNFGSKMIIINYRNNKDMNVYFPEYDYTKTNVNYGDFKKGNIICPYERRYHGKGYMGEGSYKVKINGKHTKHYDVWSDMLRRCYDFKYIQQHPSYVGCRVHDSWLNFQIFSDWFQSNYYQIEGEQICLDKDILSKGNKIYSPDTCIFVPQTINKLFTKSNEIRGRFPVGVYYKKENKKYIAQCNVNKKQKHLGCYDTPEEAFQVYKNFKEKHIEEVAEEYKNKIPTKLYNAMITYEVEIDD